MSQQDHTWSPTDCEMQTALRDEGFAVHYQPIYGSDDLDLVAYESLLRWPHPVQGMIPPQRFIPVAEQGEAIHDLGLWVLRRACRDLAALSSRYVGVNVSAVQLQDASFADRFARVIRDERVEPAQVTVEITESVPLQDGRTERRNLDAIRELGCYLAIDDFGTGYAGRDYIDKFPFNALKIDKSFIRDLAVSATARNVVASICEIGRQREIVIVAEGVETTEQLDVLRQLRCPRVQGYLLGRPAPAGSHDGRSPPTNPKP